MKTAEEIRALEKETGRVWLYTKDSLGCPGENHPTTPCPLPCGCIVCDACVELRGRPWGECGCNEEEGTNE